MSKYGWPECRQEIRCIFPDQVITKCEFRGDLYVHAQPAFLQLMPGLVVPLVKTEKVVWDIDNDI